MVLDSHIPHIGRKLGRERGLDLNLPICASSPMMFVFFLLLFFFLLSNRGKRINKYKYHFVSSHFSFQYFSTFLFSSQTHTHERKLN